MSKPKILSCDMRVQLILSTVEDAMSKIARIGTSPTRIPLTPAAIEKRHREAREELKREVRRIVSGRGRDVLGLVRQYVEENEEPGFDREHERVMVVYASELLSVIDAGFVAEDEPVAGERCPLCERGMTEHTRIDLYGTDAFLCSGSTRDGVIINIAHPQALARLHEAATREAQRQFDELTTGSEARHRAEDYAAILDVLAELPPEQLEGLEWEEESAEFAPVIRQLLTRGPLLERERLEGVVRDAVRQSLAPLNLQVVDLTPGIYDIDDPTREKVYAEAVARLVTNLLNALFPVRVEYVSTEESERVERARQEPPPITVGVRYLNSAGEEVEAAGNVALAPQFSPQGQTLFFPPMVEGQTHWLIGNDYGLYYKVDAEGRVTRLENEHATPTASFAPEDVQSGDTYGREPGQPLTATITGIVDESSVRYYVECENIECSYEGLGSEGDPCPTCSKGLVYAQREDTAPE